MAGLKSRTAQTVVSCYSLLDLTVTAGIEDYTDGIYEGDVNRPYKDAQRTQGNYLLDEVRCRKGSRILDIGCGNGTLLELIRERNAVGSGITISQPQVNRCKRKGFEVYLMNYRDIPKKWNDQFEGIIANGSIEHFVQPQDVIAGRQDEIYRELFEICCRILNPSSEDGRFVTTIIHYNREPNPQDVLNSPFSFPKDSDQFHYSLLNKAFGGYYPVKGQLERCAKGIFELEKEVDGTYDYHLTSEHWLKQFKKALFINPVFMAKLAGKIIRHPCHTSAMLACLSGPQSWAWQFRTDNPPTKLLRQTWRCSG
ncbi:MAG: class I SAM-dependent methyltransferase [Proteobacteria bacterium]|nr:class I SAM-dependent methyltransferase [Pseudomonadota bacterium]